jgi:hypothetical protein
MIYIVEIRELKESSREPCVLFGSILDHKRTTVSGFDKLTGAHDNNAFSPPYTSSSPPHTVTKKNTGVEMKAQCIAFYKSYPLYFGNELCCILTCRLFKAFNNIVNWSSISREEI